MDQLRALRWPLVAASLAVTLGLLLAGSRAVQATLADAPLDHFLRAQPAVAAINVERDGALRRVTVELKEVPDLAEAYRHLEAGVRRALGSDRFVLAVRDRRTAALSEVFYRINPLIQEALATGRYGDLLEKVEARARALGAQQVRVGIDSRRVYVQVHGGGGYLYEVLPRPDAPAAVPDGRAEGGWSL